MVDGQQPRIEQTESKPGAPKPSTLSDFLKNNMALYQDAAGQRPLTARLHDVAIDGLESDEDGEVASLDSTNNVEYPDGSAVSFDTDNQLVWVRDAEGNERRLEWQDGRIQKMIAPGGREWTNVGDDQWTSNDGKTWTGQMTVREDGTFTEISRDGSLHIYKRDGSYVSVDYKTASRAADAIYAEVGIGTDSDAIRRQLEGTSDEFRKMVDDIYTLRHDARGIEKMLQDEGETELIGLFIRKDGVSNWDQLERDADAIEAASNEGGFLWSGGGTSEENINEILKNRSPEERALLDDIFRRKHGWQYGDNWGLKQEFQDEMDTGGFEYQKALSLLEQGEGDHAGRIRTALLEHDASFTANRSNAVIEQDIRDTIRTMTAQEIADLKLSYTKQFDGRSLEDDLLGDDSSLSDETKAALRIYLGDERHPGGRDNLDDRDFAKLARIGLTSGNLAMFKEAMAGASQSSRERIMIDENIVGEVLDTFSGYELQHALDYALDGKLSRGTQIGDNIQWSGDNENQIEAIVRDFTDEERQNYVAGKTLVAGETVDGMTESERIEARRFYESVHAALESGSSKEEMQKWESMIDGSEQQAESAPDETELEIRELMESDVSLVDKMAAFDGLNDDEMGAYTALTMAAPQELNDIINDPEKYLSFLSSDDMEVALNIARQGGEFRPEDKVRAFMLGSGTSEAEIHSLLNGLNSDELEQMKQNYATKYATSLTADLLSEMGGGDETQAMGEVRTRATTTGGAYDDARDEVYLERQGIGSWLVDNTWDGSGFRADEMHNAFTQALMHDNRSLTVDQAQEMAREVTGALESFRRSRAAMGEAAADIALAATAVVLAFTPGGQPASAAILQRLGAFATRIPGMVNLGIKGQQAVGAVVAGGLFRPTFMAGIQGQSYDGANMPVDFASGAADALTGMLTPTKISQVIGVGADMVEEQTGNAARDILKRLILTAPSGAAGGLAGATVRWDPDLSFNENLKVLGVSTLFAGGAAGGMSLGAEVFGLARRGFHIVGDALADAGDNLGDDLGDALDEALDEAIEASGSSLPDPIVTSPDAGLPVIGNDADDLIDDDSILGPGNGNPKGDGTPDTSGGSGSGGEVAADGADGTTDGSSDSSGTSGQNAGTSGTAIGDNLDPAPDATIDTPEAEAPDVAKEVDTDTTDGEAPDTKDGDASDSAQDESGNTANDEADGDPYSHSTMPLVSGQSSPILEYNGGRDVWDQEQIVIGRGDGADIAFDVPAVSRRHAVIHREGNRYFLRNESQNGTMVNQRLVEGQVELHPGDRIVLGQNTSLPKLKFGETTVDLRLRADSVQAAPGPISQAAVAQSNAFAGAHKLTDPIEDGFSNAGRRASFDADGMPLVSDRSIDIVDRANDPILANTIEVAVDKFEALPPRQRAEALTAYVKELLEPGSDSEMLDYWHKNFTKSHRGQRVPLGEYIRQGKGVCSQQATLLKVLADEFPDMKASLVRGASQGQSHAWVEFDFGSGEPVIFDPRHPEYTGMTYRDGIPYRPFGVYGIPEHLQ